MAVDIDEDEFLSIDLVFQNLRELGHGFIIRKDNELDLVVLEMEVVRNTPLALMCIIYRFASELF